VTTLLERTTTPTDLPRATKSVLPIACGATFLAFLDVTVVNLAFPDLLRNFAGASVADMSWVVTAYAVLFAALLAPAGRIADVVGRRTLFLAGVVAFTLASLASALAPTLGVLIATRALQGVAAAVMIPAALGLVLAATPVERRHAAVGLWGATAALAAAVGPSLGGLLVDAFDWRAVFVINVPIGFVLAYATRRIGADVRTPGALLPDLLGTGLLASGVALVVLGTTKAGDWGWVSGATIGSLLLGAVLLGFVVVRSRRHYAPAIETRLWRNRVFAAANATSLFFGAFMYAWLLLCVLFVTLVWHYSVLKAGLAVSPGAFTAAIASVITGRLGDRRGQRIAVMSGALLCAGVGLWILFGVTTHPSFLALWLPAGLVGGAGMGAVLTGLSSTAALSVEPAQFASATGLAMTARQLGGALGIAALAALVPAGVAQPGLATFRHVFVFCICAAVLSAVAAIGLDER
jgi:EmrB/QacA subfamily drug resistance transporter